MDTEPANNNQKETFDEQGNLLPPTPKINLHDAHAIRREMACVYRDMRAGRIDPADGTKYVYVLDMIRKAYETAVLEERMDAVQLLLKNWKISE